jgi:hypothetical protein
MGAPMTETVVDPATFKEMRNGQILAYVRDNLLRRADRIRTIEERLIGDRPCERMARREPRRP